MEQIKFPFYRNLEKNILVLDFFFNLVVLVTQLGWHWIFDNKIIIPLLLVLACINESRLQCVTFCYVYSFLVLANLWKLLVDLLYY